MTPYEILTIALSGIAIIVSGFTAYKTLFARFKGLISISNTLVLMKLDKIPSIGVATFFQNSGAKVGRLDDIRLHVKNTGVGKERDFYPQLMRKDYNIFESYSTSDWYVFSPIQIDAKACYERYILFKPLDDSFKTSKGKMIVRLEVKWSNKKEWQVVSTCSTFDLSKEVSDNWSNPDEPAFTILSDEAMKIRGIDG